MDQADRTPSGEGQSAEPSTVRAIPLHEIDDSDRTFQFRSEDTRESLVSSLENEGQLTPIKVIAAGKTYRILDGFRRTAAARVLGWKTIDAVVYAPMFAGARKIAFIANVVHESLTVPERANGIKLARREGYTKSEVAEMFGISQRQIERYLALPDAVLQWIDGRSITMADARVLAAHLRAIPPGHLPELIEEIRRTSVSAKALPDWLLARGIATVAPARRPHTVGNITGDKVRFYNAEITRSSSAAACELALDFLRRATRRIEEFSCDSIGRADDEFENESA